MQSLVIKPGSAGWLETWCVKPENKVYKKKEEVYNNSKFLL
jgi:hypothetical protein